MGILNVKDRITEFSNRFKLTDIDTGTSKTYDLEQVTGEITEVGTPINRALFDELDKVYSVYTIPTVEQVAGETSVPITSNIFGQINNISTGEGMCSGNQEYMTFNISSSNTIAIGSEYVGDTTYIGSIIANDAKNTLSDINSILKRTTYDDSYYIRINTKGMKSNILSFDFDLQRPRNCKLKFRLKGGTIMGHTCVVTASNDNETWEQIAFYDNLDSNNANAKTIPINNYRYIKCSFNATTTLSSNQLYIYYLYLSDVDDSMYVESNTNFFTLPYDLSNLNVNQRVLLETPQKTSFEETVFNSGLCNHTSSTTLSNGNVLIAYQDGGNSNYGTFVIVDENRNIVKDETVFNSDGTFDISSTTLSNGNVLIAYRNYNRITSNSNSGAFVIVDQNGNIIKDKTVFNSASAYYISPTTLSNGNVLIAYQDGGNSNYGTFVIINQNGNVVKGETVFNSVSTSYISSTTLNNGNVLIAYDVAVDSSYGTFVILDQNGNIVKDETVFSSEDMDHTSTTLLSNGNVLIAYITGIHSYGVFIIVDENGNIVKDETVFNSENTNAISTTTLNNDNVLIAYRDSTNNSYGTFVILDQNGNIVKDETVFNKATTDYISTTTLNNGNVLIAYRDLGNSDYGTFVIVDFEKLNSTYTIDGVAVNKLNNIPIKNILQPSTKYELVYDGEKFIDNTKGKILYDITLEEAVNQVDLPGISNVLEENRLYACIITGSSSTITLVYLGDCDIGYLKTSETLSLGLFEFYKEVTSSSSTYYIRSIFSNDTNASSDMGYVYAGTTNKEYIKANSTYTFNAGTRFIIKEIG